MHTWVRAGICMRAGLASHPQRDTATLGWLLQPGGWSFYLSRSQYFPGWSPVLSTQTESGEGSSTSPGEDCVAPSEVMSPVLLLSPAPRPRTECPLHPGVPGGHLVTSNLRILFFHICPFYLLQHYNHAHLHCSPDSFLAPHFCPPLCLTLLKFAHHCHEDGP